MVEDDSDKKACACTQKQRDPSRAAQPAKEPSLIKTTCDHCGKKFWTDSEREYCFDCEVKGKE